MEVDKYNYTRKYARKRASKIGLILMYLRIIDPYLDYQVWKEKYNLWNPLTWLFLIIYIPIIILLCGIINLPEFLPKNKFQFKRHKYSYWNAPENFKEKN